MLTFAQIISFFDKNKLSY